MARPHNNLFWSTLFASALKVSFAFSVADKLHFARRYSWSRTSVGYWINGRNLPSHEALRDLKEYFYGIEAQRDEIEMLKNITRIAFESKGIGYVHELLFFFEPVTCWSANLKHAWHFVRSLERKEGHYRISERLAIQRSNQSRRV